MTTHNAHAAPLRPVPTGRRATVRHERSATRIVVATLGAVIGLAGIEHGIGEIRQGNVATDGFAILSWPDSDAYRIVGGEPALTIVPNLLVTGILAIAVSLAFLVWAIAFAGRRHGGLVLILLAIGMLLFGGGIMPPLIGIALGFMATRIGTPFAWWRAHLSTATRRRLGLLWPWALAGDVAAWLLLLPGSAVLGALTGADDAASVAPGLVYAVILAAFGLLLLAIVASLAHDSLMCADNDLGHAPRPNPLAPPQ